MSDFFSPGVWLTLVGALGGLGYLMVRHDRANRLRPKQRHGIDPHEQPKINFVDIGQDELGRAANAYHVPSNPQVYAKTFVPSHQKD
jgi:hypothetical protein